MQPAEVTDSQRLQQIVNAAVRHGQKKVDLPAGHYQIDEPILIPSDGTVVGRRKDSCTFDLRCEKLYNGLPPDAWNAKFPDSPTTAHHDKVLALLQEKGATPLGTLLQEMLERHQMDNLAAFECVLGMRVMGKVSYDSDFLASGKLVSLPG
jgi:hypothetical protein